MDPHPAESSIDELLVLLWASGRADAGERLAERWHDRLWAHARILSDSGEEATDAVQAAWLDMARGRGALRDPARFGSWAYRIVTRRCADQVRRRRRERALRREASPTPREVPAGTPGDDGALRRALGVLSRDDHALLRLVHVEGLTLRQAGVVFDIPVGTVKSRLHHARAALRAALDRGDDR